MSSQAPVEVQSQNVNVFGQGFGLSIPTPDLQAHGLQGPSPMILQAPKLDIPGYQGATMFNDISGIIQPGLPAPLDLDHQLLNGGMQPLGLDGQNFIFYPEGNSLENAQEDEGYTSPVASPKKDKPVKTRDATLKKKANTKQFCCLI